MATAPRNMLQHCLNPIGGVAMDIETLNFSAPLAAAVTIDPFYGGRVVHLNDSGYFETGVPDGTNANATASKAHMPLFTFQDSDSPDVQNYGGISGSAGDAPNSWISAGPSGKIKAFVATGATELQTTEFVPEATLGSTYSPGDTLKAAVANTTLATGGVLTKGLLGTNAIVGVVSRAVYKNENGYNVLSFWPVLLPVYPVIAHTHASNGAGAVVVA